MNEKNMAINQGVLSQHSTEKYADKLLHKVKEGRCALHREVKWMSCIIERRATVATAICMVVGSILLAASIVLMSDKVQAYGWSVSCFMASGYFLLKAKKGDVLHG